MEIVDGAYFIIRIIIKLQLVIEESLHPHRSLAAVIPHLRDSFRNDLLKYVRCPVGEVIRACHRRSRNTEKLLERLLEMIQAQPVDLFLRMFH